MATTRVLSVEDGNLNKSTLVVSRKRDYIDLDLSFTAKESGELYKKFDAAAVKQAVKTLISTNRFEKPFQPNFGADIRGMLFELANDPYVALEIKEKIKEVVRIYEPRIEIIEIDVNEKRDLNTLSVIFTFKVINSDEIVTLTTSFARLR